jgi:hypothetical protein
MTHAEGRLKSVSTYSPELQLSIPSKPPHSTCLHIPRYAEYIGEDLPRLKQGWQARSRLGRRLQALEEFLWHKWHFPSPLLETKGAGPGGLLGLACSELEALYRLVC